MIIGGIEKVGMGILSGLAPWRKDWLLLMGHEEYIFETYGIRPSVLGVPRLKPADGAIIKETPFIPNDNEFLYAIALHNIYSPSTLPFVNTRETWDLCLTIAKGGGCLFTFNCSTIPGGYTSKSAEYQFPAFDFDIDNFNESAKNSGLMPTLNWNFDIIKELKSQ